ncbi:MAG TPA: FG-GAP-like repeat-containing protein [Bryobacteraceae bacterium]|nr:FG-GAP-like repeat-containing protein [Bryobacteraceae bacterium]
MNVIYGSQNGLVAGSAGTPAPQEWTPTNTDARTFGADPTGANFGWALAAGDFNGDGYSDLAILVPHLSELFLFQSLTFSDIIVLYGSPNGLSNTDPSPNRQEQEFSVCDSGTTGGLAWGDFDRDGFGDIAVGCTDTNAVVVLHGTNSGRFNLSGGVPALPAFFKGTLGQVLAAGDFNGDGYTDLAIGVPDADLLDTSNFLQCLVGCPVKLAGVGLIMVLYSNGFQPDATLPQIWYQGANTICCHLEANAHFGAALAPGDFNGDGKQDLAVGIPNASVGGVAGAGAAVVIYGSSAGLAPGGNQIWNENDFGTPAQPGNRFSTALAAGDFNGDGRADLAIGIPFEPASGLKDSGQVDVVYGSASGLSVSAHAAQLWHQGGSVLGAPQVSGHFGASLSAWNFGHNEFTFSLAGGLVIHPTADLAVGAPGYTVSGIAGAGVINVLYGSIFTNGLTSSNNQLFTQGSLGFGTSADHFGYTMY